MKNIFKVIGSVIPAYFVAIFIEILFISYLPIATSPTRIEMLIGYVLEPIVFIILFSLLWGIFLRDKNIDAPFLRQIKLKKTYYTLLVIFTLFAFLQSFASVSLITVDYGSIIDDYSKTSHFIGDSIYENSKYHFRLVYPKGSVFANANPESGFVTRFFIPNGESIGNDEENVGIYIKENSGDLETEVKQIKDSFSKNGPVDIQEVQFGGQKGYKILLTTDYSAQKGTRELIYITVKNAISYELNYFPVAKNISVVDSVASSFEFTQ